MNTKNYQKLSESLEFLESSNYSVEVHEVNHATNFDVYEQLVAGYLIHVNTPDFKNGLSLFYNDETDIHAVMVRNWGTWSVVTFDRLIEILCDPTIHDWNVHRPDNNFEDLDLDNLDI